MATIAPTIVIETGFPAWSKMELVEWMEMLETASVLAAAHAGMPLVAAAVFKHEE